MPRAKGKAADWHMHNAMMEAVAALGWKVELSDRETVVASDGQVRLRALQGGAVIQFGVEADFDRWANSTDLTFDARDFDQDEVQEAMRCAAWLVRRGFRKPWAEPAVDLRDRLKQFRKAEAKAAQEAPAAQAPKPSGRRAASRR